MNQRRRKLQVVTVCLALLGGLAVLWFYLNADNKPATTDHKNLHDGTAIEANNNSPVAFPATLRPVITLSATNYLGNNTYTDHPVTRRIKRALDTLGYDLQIMHNPGLRSLAMANSGVVDGELIRIRSVSNDYPNLLLVPVPLIHASVGLYTHRRHAESTQSWQNFSATRFAAVKGMMLLEKLPEKFAATPIIYAQGYQQAVHQVIADRADLTLLPSGYVDRLLDRQEAAELVLLQPPLPPAEGFLHLHKRHEHLVQPLTRLLKAQDSPQRGATDEAPAVSHP